MIRQLGVDIGSHWVFNWGSLGDLRGGGGWRVRGLRGFEVGSRGDLLFPLTSIVRPSESFVRHQIWCLTPHDSQTSSSTLDITHQAVYFWTINPVLRAPK